jgi:hypothetical protein
VGNLRKDTGHDETVGAKREHAKGEKQETTIHDEPVFNLI